MRGLLDQSVRDSPVGPLVCTRSGDVGVYLDNCTFPLTLRHTSFECRTGCLLFGLLLLGVAIVNFLSHLEESDLQWTIIFLTLHAANRFLPLMFTTANYLRGHVALDCKSPEPQGFGAEGTLGILFVPTTRVFPGKVCHINCTEE